MVSTLPGGHDLRDPGEVGGQGARVVQHRVPQLFDLRDPGNVLQQPDKVPPNVDHFRKSVPNQAYYEVYLFRSETRTNGSQK